MTELEHVVLNHLVEAWNAFLQLPTEHADDVAEFRHGIHAMQLMIMARPARRQINETDFRAKAGEDAQAMTGGASDDPVSRASETSRQKGLDVEITDGCQHGGKEEPAAADRHAPMSHGTAPAMEQGLSGARRELINPSSGQRDIEVRTLGGATNSPEQASTGAVTGWVDPPSTQTGSSDLRDVILPLTSGQTSVTVGGDERGTVVNSINERCRQPKTCKFGNHPQKITCFQCGSEWAAEAKKSEAA